MKSQFRAWDEGNKVMHKDFQFVTSGDEGNDWIIFTSDNQPINETMDWTRNPFFAQQLKKMEFSGWYDATKTPIFEEDIIELTNGNEDLIQVVCKKGFAKRTMVLLDETDEVEVEISGFYFELPSGHKTFPIVSNYLGQHDTEIFKIIGNTYQGILNQN